MRISIGGNAPPKGFIEYRPCDLAGFRCDRHNVNCDFADLIHRCAIHRFELQILNWHHCQCVFFLSIFDCCMIHGDNMRALIGTAMRKSQLQANAPKKCHYIHKQVKYMLRLLCYASVAAWYCFNVSVFLFSVLPLRAFLTELARKIINYVLFGKRNVMASNCCILCE